MAFHCAVLAEVVTAVAGKDAYSLCRDDDADGAVQSRPAASDGY